MNLETKITIYKFTPQLFTLTPYDSLACDKLGGFCVFLLCISFRISCCEQIHHCFVLEK